VPIHAGNGPGLTTRNLGTKSGQATVALPTTQIPAHGHASAATSAQLRAHAANDADQGAPASTNLLGKFQGPMIGTNAYSNSDANLVALNDVGENIVVTPAGGGQGHNNRQPFLGLNYIIALVGLFPPRN
jgi:microcystin-dependent protein